MPPEARQIATEGFFWKVWLHVPGKPTLRHAMSHNPVMTQRCCNYYSLRQVSGTTISPSLLFQLVSSDFFSVSRGSWHCVLACNIFTVVPNVYVTFSCWSFTLVMSRDHSEIPGNLLSEAQSCSDSGNGIYAVPPSLGRAGPFFQRSGWSLIQDIWSQSLNLLARSRHRPA